MLSKWFYTRPLRLVTVYIFTWIMGISPFLFPTPEIAKTLIFVPFIFSFIIPLIIKENCVKCGSDTYYDKITKKFRCEDCGIETNKESSKKGNKDEFGDIQFRKAIDNLETQEDLLNNIRTDKRLLRQIKRENKNIPNCKNYQKSFKKIRKELNY